MRRYRRYNRGEGGILFQRYFIGVAMRHLNFTRETYSARGIKSGHTKVLRTLEEYGDCIQVEISRYCDITPATTVSLLNVMEKDGLIERHSVPQDRRAIRVCLTEKGRAQIAVLDELDETLSEMLLDGFSPEEATSFQNYLERMKQNIERFSR